MKTFFASLSKKFWSFLRKPNYFSKKSIFLLLASAGLTVIIFIFTATDYFIVSQTQNPDITTMNKVISTELDSPPTATDSAKRTFEEVLGFTKTPVPTATPTSNQIGEITPKPETTKQQNLSRIEVNFEVIIDNATTGASSNLTFKIQNNSGSDNLKSYEILIPQGFKINQGDAIGNNKLIGSGRVISAGNSQIAVTIINKSDTQGHKARLRFLFGDPDSPDSFLDSFIDEVDNGHKWVVDRGLFNSLASPIIGEFTIFGKVGDLAMVTNPQSGGDYQFSLNVVSVNGLAASFEKIVSIF